MTLLRVPIVNREQLQALRTLLRMDFTRALRNALTEQQQISLQCVAVLQLTEYLTQAEQPLVIVASMMQFHGYPTAMLPLDSTRFAFFTRLLSISLDTKDFPGVDPEQADTVLAPLRGLVGELQKIFEASGHLDENAIHSKMKTPTPTGMLN